MSLWRFWLILLLLSARTFYSWLEGRPSLPLQRLWSSVQFQSWFVSQVSVWKRERSTASSLASTPASMFTWVPDTSWRVSLSHCCTSCWDWATSSLHVDRSSPSDSWFQKKWGHNVSEFRQRFDSELTAGEGPKRLRNLYFLYLIELRALAKSLPFFQQRSFQLFTGWAEDDQRNKEMLLDILQLARSAWKQKLKLVTDRCSFMCPIHSLVHLFYTFLQPLFYVLLLCWQFKVPDQSWYEADTLLIQFYY